MIHRYMFISHIRMCLMPLTGWKGAWRMSKSGYLQISCSSTLIKPNSLFLVQKFTVKNSTNPFQLTFLANFLSPVGVVRNLCVWFDSDFSFSRHVQNICKSCFAQIRDLRRLRGYLTHHAALMAANALVGSQLDYCNSLFRSLSSLDLRKLQCIQNSLARIVTNTTKYSHITPVRKILHWLPIEQRSIFKTALLVYKLLNCGQPRYFAPFLKPIQSVYNTRKSQADGVFLELPHFATSLYKSSKHFGLSFAYDAPKIWNDLPDDVRSATSLHSFRRKLQAYLFAQAYPP